MQRLEPKSTLLLVVDVQDRLAAAMPRERMDALIANTSILLEAAKLLGVPVVASEQYPKGLGATVAPIAEKLEAMGVTASPKTTFDACEEPAVARALSSIAPRAVVVLGMETHVCVMQTARELARRGLPTYVVADAVASRREENRTVGLSLCERAGATVTVTESVLFDWLRAAGSPEFKAISSLLK